MQQEPKPYDLNLSPLTNEELLIMARDCGFLPAEHRLLANVSAATEAHVWRLIWRYRLLRLDGEDMYQEAWLWAIEAVHSYKMSHLEEPKPCLFDSFLWMVIERRGADFVRRYRRREAHVDHSADAQRILATFVRPRVLIQRNPRQRART